MKQVLKRKQQLLKILIITFFLFFLFVVSSVGMFFYLLNRTGQVEDYCSKVASKEIADNPNHPEWVKPPSWYHGTVKDKMGYGYYKQLECGGKKFGLFEKIPQE